MGIWTSGKALGVLLGVVVASCTTSEMNIEDARELIPVQAEILGIWVLEAFTVDGVTVQVELDQNTAETPYLEITDSLNGNFGCNRFVGGEDSYRYDQGMLVPGETITELSHCLPEALNETEDAFRDMVWLNEEIDVDIVGDSMWWERDGETLTFTRLDEEPLSQAPTETARGPLVCTPDPVSRDRVPADGSDLDDFMRAGEALTQGFEQVVSVEQPDPTAPVWFGYDAVGEAIVSVAFDDVTPHTFSVYTCP